MIVNGSSSALESWSLVDGRRQYRLPGANGATIAAAFIDNKQLVTMWADHRTRTSELRLIDAATGDLIRVIGKVQMEGFFDMAVSAASHRILLVNLSNFALYDLDTGELVMASEPAQSKNPPLQLLRRASGAFVRGGELFVYLGNSRKIELRDSKTGKRVVETDAERDETAVAPLGDGRIVIAADMAHGNCRLVDLVTGERKRFDTRQKLHIVQEANVIAISPSGQRVGVVTPQGTLLIEYKEEKLLPVAWFSKASGPPRATFAGSDDEMLFQSPRQRMIRLNAASPDKPWPAESFRAIDCLLASPTGKRLMVRCLDTAYFVDLASGKSESVFGGIGACPPTFPSDDMLVYSGWKQVMKLSLDKWTHIEGRKFEQTLSGKPMAISRDGKRFVFVDVRGSVLVRAVEEEDAEAIDIECAGQDIYYLGFADHGRKLVIVTDKALQIWGISEKKMLDSKASGYQHGQWLRRIVQDPEGRWICVQFGDKTNCYRITSSGRLQNMELQVPPGRLLCSVSASGALAIVTGVDVYDVPTGKSIITGLPTTLNTNLAAYLSDGRLATTMKDRYSLEVWSIPAVMASRLPPLGKFPDGQTHLEDRLLSDNPTLAYASACAALADGTLDPALQKLELAANEAQAKVDGADALVSELLTCEKSRRNAVHRQIERIGPLAGPAVRDATAPESDRELCERIESLQQLLTHDPQPEALKLVHYRPRLVEWRQWINGQRAGLLEPAMAK